MTLWKDSRFALRALRRSPGFSFTVIAILGLTIGANTAVYSVLDAVLFRAIPFPQPERLAGLRATFTYRGRHVSDDSQTGHQFLSMRDAAPGLDIGAYAGDSGANFAAQGRLEYVSQQRVSAGFFRVLGVPPQLGREFSRAEDVPGGPAVAILSYGFWQRIFQGDPGALGRAITLRGEPYTVIGVMPPGFRFTSAVDVWTPLRPTTAGEGSGSNYGALARLRTGTSWAEAEGQLQALSQALKDNLPRDASDFEERLMPFHNSMTLDLRGSLLVAWAAVGVVLVIGCVNIAGLLLARSAQRSREIATRLAVGGSRGRIVGQLLMESLVLALCGALVGVGAGWFALDGLKYLGASSYELWHPIALNVRVLAVTLGTALATSLLFGLAPAIATSRIDIRSVLVEGGRGMAGHRRRWPGQVLVAAEVAMSLTLLIAAGLLVRTMAYLNGLNPGFDTRNVVAASASLQDKRYETSVAVNRLFRDSSERIRRIPGVKSAAVALTLPYERPLNDSFRPVDGKDNRGRSGEFVYATPGYFATMRIPVQEGREFRDSDLAGSMPVTVVSRSFANRYFDGAAMGRHVRFWDHTAEIVGVVGDIEQHSGLDGSQGPLRIEPTIYVPAEQTSGDAFRLVHTWFTPKWVIRTTGPLQGLETQVRAAIAAADSQLPVAEFRTVDQLRGRYISEQRFRAMLFSVLAGLALLLAAIGLYGVISHGVAERTHEIGVRLALGATAPQAMWNVMKSGLLLSMAGVAVGSLASLAAVRLLGSLLWGVRATDPLTFVGASLVLLVIAATASIAPTVRILRLDPAETLRRD